MSAQVELLPAAQLRRPELLLRVVVAGEPISQGSMTCIGAFGGAKHHQVVPSNASKLKPWRKAVKDAAEAHRLRPDPYDLPVEIRLLFAFTLPASAPKSWAERAEWAVPMREADGDKLQRAIWDALQHAKILTNDARCWRWSGVKLWTADPDCPLDTPGVLLEVWTRG